MRFIAYHISEHNFNKFDNSQRIGNRATILDASYFVSLKNEVYNFGDKGIIYTVELTPRTLFKFDLDDEGWTSLEFQQKFSEQLAGLDNELSDYIENVNAVDCIALKNLEYSYKKNLIEYIVLNTNIIRILSKQVIK